jgi:hypothetical protein
MSGERERRVAVSKSGDWFSVWGRYWRESEGEREREGVREGWGGRGGVGELL